MAGDPIMRMGSVITNTLYEELQKRGLVQRVGLTVIEDLAASVMNALTPEILQEVLNSSDFIDLEGGEARKED